MKGVLFKFELLMFEEHAIHHSSFRIHPSALLFYGSMSMSSGTNSMAMASPSKSARALFDGR